MYQHLKGTNVNLLIKTGVSAYTVIAASDQCNFNITANTIESASKTDRGDGMFSRPEFVNCDWNVSNESFVVDIEFLNYLLNKVLNGDATIDIKYDLSLAAEPLSLIGKCIITNLEITANNGEFAKVRMSMAGTSKIDTGDQMSFIAKTDSRKIKGKAFMCAIRTGAETWSTIACATSHTLSIDVQTEDINDKDINDSIVKKEVVGKSVKVTTSNLISNSESGEYDGMTFEDIVTRAINGTSVNLEFGYYPSSIGAEVHDEEINEGWGKAEEVLVEGTFLITSVSQNGTVKQNATFTAEFSNMSEVTAKAV